MKMRQMTVLACGFACALLALAPLASASDGVVLINQATASRNGGALPGCTAQTGYLITICNPGSYELSGNLIASNSGIYIGASNVTLNLNGFTLSGSGNGVQTDIHGEVDYLVIENGTLQGFEYGISDTYTTCTKRLAGGACENFSVGTSYGLTARNLTIVFINGGISASSVESVLVEDSTLDGPSAIADGVNADHGLVTRCTILVGGGGTGVGGDVLVSDNNIVAATPLDDPLSANNNSCNGTFPC